MDLIRTVTIAGVVAVHTVGLIGLYFGVGHFFQDVNGAFVALLHYTRESFMFLTGLVLFHRYGNGPFSALKFWKKRFPATLIPYVFWSLLYVGVLELQIHQSLPQILKNMAVDLGLGTASYQLYYMVVTFQFYLLFPVLFWLFTRFAHRLDVILLVSLAFEGLWLAILGPANIYPFKASWTFGALYESHFVLSYLFYFVAGGWVAMNRERVLAFLSQYRTLAIALGLASVLGLLVHYALAIGPYGLSDGAAVTVLQPIMIPYSMAIVLFIYLGGLSLARAGEEGRSTFFATAVRRFADASFGIYLCHALFLNYLLRSVVPHLTWPLPVQMVVVWVVTLAVSYLVTRALMAFPLTGLLVGKPATRSPRHVPQTHVSPTQV